jgi:hypothetical protein
VKNVKILAVNSRNDRTRLGSQVRVQNFGTGYRGEIRQDLEQELDREGDKTGPNSSIMFATGSERSLAI